MPIQVGTLFYNTDLAMKIAKTDELRNLLNNLHKKIDRKLNTDYQLYFLDNRSFYDNYEWIKSFYQEMRNDLINLISKADIYKRQEVVIPGFDQEIKNIRQRFEVNISPLTPANLNTIAAKIFAETQSTSIDRPAYTY